MTTPSTPTEPDKRCGTTAGYKTHQRRGEESCTPCQVANAEQTSKWKRKNPTKAATWQAARSRALCRLAREYPERYRQILDEERAQAAEVKP